MSGFGLDPAPDLMNVVVGFRGFHWNGKDPILHGGYSWEAGENVAVCSVGRPHKAPDNDCTCGLYAYHDLSRMDTNGSYGPITAAVAAWGKMCVHKDGFRAEKAQVIAIAFLKDIAEVFNQAAGTPAPRFAAIKKQLGQQGLPDEKAMEEIAKAYGVPFLAWEELEPYALEHGEPLPSEMVPGRSAGKLAIKSPAAPKGKVIPIPPQSPAVIGSGATLPTSTQEQATTRVARPRPSTRQIPVASRDDTPVISRDDKLYVQYSPNSRYSDVLLLTLPGQLGGVVVSLFEFKNTNALPWALMLAFFVITSVCTIYTERTKL